MYEKGIKRDPVIVGLCYPSNKKNQLDLLLNYAREAVTIPGTVDLIVFPEFATKYTNSSEDMKYAQYISEKNHGEDFEIYSSLAIETKAYVLGWSFEKDDAGLFYNTSYLFNRDGKFVGQYRKGFRHPHWITVEHENPVFETDFGRIGVMICGDMWLSTPCNHGVNNISDLIGKDVRFIIHPTAGRDLYRVIKLLSSKYNISIFSVPWEGGAYLMDNRGQLVDWLPGGAGGALKLKLSPPDGVWNAIDGLEHTKDANWEWGTGMRITSPEEKGFMMGRGDNLTDLLLNGCAYINSNDASLDKCWGEFTFTGTRVRLFGWKQDPGLMSVSIDNRKEEIVDLYSKPYFIGHIWSSDILPEGKHKLKIKLISGEMIIDYAEHFTHSGNLPIPKISNIEIKNFSTTSVRINWTTDRPCLSKVGYLIWEQNYRYNCVDALYDNKSGLYTAPTGFDSTYKIHHEIFIERLPMDCYNYKFIICAKNENGLESNSWPIEQGYCGF